MSFNYTSTPFCTTKPTTTKPIAFPSNIPTHTRGVLLLVLLLGWAAHPSFSYRTFGFDIHHRFSDPVKRILDLGNGLDKLPKQGTVEFFAALAHRDLAVHGRRLSASTVAADTPVTFSSGNITYRIDAFGFLQYANVTVGTPGMSFLVALDTGSDLFWLPCDCDSCVEGVKTSRSQEIDFNIYSPNTSSTGTKISCHSPVCEYKASCSESPSTCPYSVIYLSANTSSSGYLVEDILHLVTDDDLSEPSNPRVPFGCGKDQTGSFLEGGAPNGLLGLGLNSISVPSVLASKKVAANSFSMCFGDDGIGRITFGDTGSSDQGETPFYVGLVNPHYNISIEQISVGRNISKLDGVHSIFDSGASFTYLNNPLYTLITEKFDSYVKDNRHSSDPDIPFEFCYDVSSSKSSPNIPQINLAMKGGDQLYLTDPTVTFVSQSGDVYCLGVLKSDVVNIIGQNFMTGYHLVFDRERMVLGWKASSCYEALDSSTLPISPQSSAQLHPVASLEPQAIPENSSQISGRSSVLSSSKFNLWTCTIIFGILQVVSILI